MSPLNQDRNKDADMDNIALMTRRNSAQKQFLTPKYQFSTQEKSAFTSNDPAINRAKVFQEVFKKNMEKKLA